MPLKHRSEEKSPRVGKTLRRLSDRELAAASGAGKGSGAATRVQLGEIVIEKKVDKASPSFFP
jgi:hypothetical protein